MPLAYFPARRDETERSDDKDDDLCLGVYIGIRACDVFAGECREDGYYTRFQCCSSWIVVCVYRYIGDGCNNGRGWRGCRRISVMRRELKGGVYIGGEFGTEIVRYLMQTYIYRGRERIEWEFVDSLSSVLIFYDKGFFLYLSY